MAELPFSRIRRAAGLVFLSGEVPFDANGMVPDGIAAQTALVLDRIAATLGTEGLTLDDVVSCTVYLVDAADFGEFNLAYARRFSAPLPVRATVVADLVVPKARVEISVIAGARN
jgi:enamine deaminase RidA (YjgF/YER057c/UK114 family)